MHINQRIPHENYENNENRIILYENHYNYGNHRIPRDNYESHENPRISYENH